MNNYLIEGHSFCLPNTKEIHSAIDLVVNIKEFGSDDSIEMKLVDLMRGIKGILKCDNRGEFVAIITEQVLLT